VLAQRKLSVDIVKCVLDTVRFVSFVTPQEDFTALCRRFAANSRRIPNHIASHSFVNFIQRPFG